MWKFIKKIFVSIYRFFKWVLVSLGLVSWVLMFPFLFYFFFESFSIAVGVEEHYMRSVASDVVVTGEYGDLNIGWGDLYNDAGTMGVLIFLFLLGPYSIIVLLRDDALRGCAYTPIRWLITPARWLIKLYAFSAGIAAVMAVGFKFNYPSLDRLDSLAIIYGTMFTAFFGYSRTIERLMRQRDNRSRTIVTTEDEIEGYYIVKSILRDSVEAKRINLRDAEDFCSINLDGNSTQPLIRLHFNETPYALSFFDKTEDGEHVEIEDLDDIYDYSNRIKATFRHYVGAGT